MTVRPKPNPNLNPTSLSKSYGPGSDQINKWIMTAFSHPCFKDVCLVEAMGMLKGSNPSVRVIVQLKDYRKQEE